MLLAKCNKHDHDMLFHLPEKKKKAHKPGETICSADYRSVTTPLSLGERELARRAF